MSETLGSHYKMVSAAIAEGEVVTVLGAGVNLCGRPRDVSWQPGQFQYLPSGAELARFLAEKIGYLPDDRRTSDLARVAQYAAVTRGPYPLYKHLHTVFDGDYPPSPVHDFLAGLPGLLRRTGCQANQLILTTNYDDVLERAFQQAGEPYDVVSYVSEGEQKKGKFLHILPDGDIRLIEKPNEYRDLSLARRSIILKIHGAVSRGGMEGDEIIEKDNYVITEDHYLDYLTRTDIAGLVPTVLAAKLRNSNLLFLGYSLRDWNLRVILHRMWGEQRLKTRSWAVQLKPDQLDCETWREHGVLILDARLEDYVAHIKEHIQALVQPAS